MNQAVDVIVIGGGIIGLAAAFHLAKRGQKVLLLKKKIPRIRFHRPLHK